MKEERGAFRILIDTLTEKISLVIIRCKWQENIRIDLKETGPIGGNDLIQLRLEINYNLHGMRPTKLEKRVNASFTRTPT